MTLKFSFANRGDRRSSDFDEAGTYIARNHTLSSDRNDIHTGQGDLARLSIEMAYEG